MFEFFLFLPLKEVAVKQFMYKKKTTITIKAAKVIIGVCTFQLLEF